MFTNEELIESLEISIKNAKQANMLQKPRLIEQCVDELLCVVKAQHRTQQAQTQAMLSIKQTIDDFKKRGFSHG